MIFHFFDEAGYTVGVAWFATVKPVFIAMTRWQSAFNV